MKNQLLLISTLIFAGTTSVMAWDNIDDRISGYTYQDADFATHRELATVGSNSISDVENRRWNGRNINLGENARYELTFIVWSNDGTNNDAEPIFNVYLAGSNSIIYGNYYGMATNWENGAAGSFHFGGNVADGDTRDLKSTYVTNSYIDDGRVSIAWQNSTLKSGPSRGSRLVDGYHRYSVVVETFSDSSQQDKIKFLYSNDYGTNVWSKDFDISSTYGIGTDEQLTVGLFLSDSWGAGEMTITNGTYTKYSRSEPTPPVVDPDPEPTLPDQPSPDQPNLPEPSAFGLLAGLGAIALAASRRRRK